MKRAIEFEQTVNFKRRIVVECKNEDVLEEICGFRGDSFGDILDQVFELNGVTLLEGDEEYLEDTNNDVRYYDDYWTKDEIKQYGDSE